MSIFSRIFGGVGTADREAKCKLCSQHFPSATLRAHMDAENAEARNYTIKRIKSRHSDWVASDGACPKCWEYYKQL